MTTGFIQRFKGKIRAHIIYLGAGGIVSNGAGGPRISQSLSLSLPVTAVTNTDLTASVPPGSIITGFDVYTTTAYGAVTDAQISIGSSAGSAAYVADTSIKAVGKVSLTLVNAAAEALLSAPNASPNLFVRIAQSGGNSATGAATLVIRYIGP